MPDLFRKFLICAAFTLALCAAPAFGCQCMQIDPVDKALADSSNVVVLKLQSLKENENAPYDFYLSVQKVFKGGLKPEEIVKFSAGGSMCTWYFSEEQIGNEFLFYLPEKPQNDAPWIVSTCSRSRGVEERAGDLRYLENEKKLRGRTRLSGTLEKFIKNADEELAGYSTSALANRKIRVAGKGKTVDLVTDEKGFYEVYDLPPGKYRVTPEKLDGYLFSSDKSAFKEIEIKAKSHTEQNFDFFIDNEISGKVVDSEGKPIAKVCLNLISVKSGKRIGFDDEYCTDEKGEFVMSLIPPGNYRLVVNEEGKITLAHPFGAFYYPNAKTAEEAAEITVGPKFFLRNLILVPPETTEMITVNGRLIYADGRPAGKMSAQFLRAEELSYSPGQVVFSDFAVDTDADGRFNLKIPKGQTGAIRGTMFWLSGKKCAEIEGFLAPDGDKLQMLETNRLEIAADKNLNGIELKFPFKECIETADK